MQRPSGLVRHRSEQYPTLYKSVSRFILLIVIFAIATPALADYIGPKDRVVTETTSVCKAVVYECQYVAAKDEYRYRRVEDWLCSNESKPWLAYDSVGPACEAWSKGRMHWAREETIHEVTTPYPPATISSSLLNCILNNGWCITSPQLSLSGSEPIADQNILALEGTRNGQIFACSGANCSVPLNEGNNDFTYWAISSWGDTSMMGTLTTNVDTQLPNITGSFTGTLGSNGWYTAPVFFNGNASDATSGLASFTCTLDGMPLGSCNSINVSTEGAHTVVLTARDNAGHARTISQNASLDLQNPVLTSTLIGMQGTNSWYTAAEINASASDPAPGSGLATLEYSLDNGGWINFPVSGVLALPDGKHSVDVRAVDTAGRTVSSSKSFWLDTLAPSIAIDPSGTLGRNGWYTTELRVAASASDATSGIDVFEYSIGNNDWTTYISPLSLRDGTHSLSFWAQDDAGLANQADRTYKVDTRVPQIAGSISGIPGKNGWYISNVELSAATSDPAPGSGIEAFTYIRNGGPETPYADALTLSNGQHIIQFNAEDKAGLKSSKEQTVKVDTIHPSLNIGTTFPNWIMNSVALNGSAGDPSTPPAGQAGSGLAKVEISTDGGQTWQPVIGTTSWVYTWNTLNNPNGIQEVQVRATDHAGLTTKRSLNAGVDNQGPRIHLPDSWYQWDTVELNIQDSHSGLSEARVEISDPEGRWPTRVIRLELEHFPLDFKWDRRFRDNTVAPLGTYDVRVVAFDHLGNMAYRNATINILLGVLPVGPTSTAQPTSRPTQTSTSLPTPTAIFTADLTQTPVVSVFGAIEPTAPVTPVAEIIPTPRATPAQTSVLDWLQSVFVPNPNAVEQVAEVISPAPLAASQASGSQSNALWGAAAAGVIGAATAYALEEKRKREEEEARQAAQVRAEVDAKNEAIQASQQAKQEALKLQNWLQGQAMLNAHIEELKKQGATAAQISDLKQLGATQGVSAAINRVSDLAESLQTATRNRNAVVDIHTARKEAIVEEEMWALGKEPEVWDKDMAQEALENWYRGEPEILPPPPQEKEPENSWWDKTKSFVSENILQPLNSNVFQPFNSLVFQPFIKPKVEQTIETLKEGFSWYYEHVSLPIFENVHKPIIENIQKAVKWADQTIYQPYLENIYEPHIKPRVDKLAGEITKGLEWADKNIYQPHILPAWEKTKQFVNEGSTWVNKNIYEPHIKPVVKLVDEKIYQPYIEPVVSDINKHIVQPYVKPLVEKASSWWEDTWDKYGEWVHTALDLVGFIPGVGDLADGINGLIYLAEGRYLEATISAMSMIPVLGDLGKAGKLSVKLGKEVMEETAEKAVKEVGEELTEKVAKEATGELTEKAAKESMGEAAEKTVKESTEEVTEKATKETTEAVAETTTKETSKQSLADRVHNALDLTGMIPGFCELSSSISSLLYLGRGQFFDATVSAVSMVPIVGGLGAAALPALKTVKELLEDVTIKATKEATENVAEKLGKEVFEETAEKSVKEAGEELADKTAKEVASSGSPIPTRKTSNTLTEEALEDVGQQIKEEDRTNSLKEQYGERANNVIDAVGPDKAETLLESLDDDVLDYVVEQGSDAVAALSLWSEKDLKEHGAELALRAKKDAQVFADVTRLIELGPIDPKNLTKEQEALIKSIAEYSTQYPDAGQVVLGKWVDYGSGFVERAQETGSVHYNPHSEMWNRLGAFENRGDVAWLINQQVIQTAINKGLPLEYTLNGIPDRNIKNEHDAILAIFSGKTDAEIMRVLKSDYMPIRMKELQELQKVGYEFVFDEVNNSYIIIPS